MSAGAAKTHTSNHKWSYPHLYLARGKNHQNKDLVGVIKFEAEFQQESNYKMVDALFSSSTMMPKFQDSQIP